MIGILVFVFSMLSLLSGRAGVIGFLLSLTGVTFGAFVLVNHTSTALF